LKQVFKTPKKERKEGWRIMSKEPTLDRVKKELEARTSEIKEEYERKIGELEEKIEQHKRERDDGLIETEKQFRQGFFVAFKSVVGEEDYSWLCKWLLKNKEKEIGEAVKRHEMNRAEEIKKMNVEDYLLDYFKEPKIERLKKDMKQSKPEEVKRLSFILTKLRLEELRESRTRF
jgi:hypothetical protein